MLKQQVADCREVFERHITHSLEVSGLTLGLKVGDKICLISHELIFCCRDNCCSILSLSNVRLSNLEQLLLLKGRNLWTHHHIWDIGQCHERFHHCLVSKDLNKSSSGEDDHISRTFLRILLSLSLLIFITLLYLPQFFSLGSTSYSTSYCRLCFGSSIGTITLRKLFLLFILFRSTFLFHSIGDKLECIDNLVHHYSFSLTVNYKRRSTILKHPERVQTCQVSLLILFWDNPWLNSIKDHVVDSNSVS